MQNSLLGRSFHPLLSLDAEVKREQPTGQQINAKAPPIKINERLKKSYIFNLYPKENCKTKMNCTYVILLLYIKKMNDKKESLPVHQIDPFMSEPRVLSQRFLL